MLNGYFLWRILFVSVLIGGGALWISQTLINEGINLNIVKTITLNTIVIPQMFHLFNVRSISGFALNKNFFTNKVAFFVCIALILLQLGITYLPFMNKIFGTYPIEAGAWIFPFGLGIIVFIIVEIEKAIVRMINKKRNKAIII